MSDVQIASKIKAGRDFTVKTKSERTKVLNAARFLGARVTTRENNSEYNVIFLP